MRFLLGNEVALEREIPNEMAEQQKEQQIRHALFRCQREA